MSLLPPIFCRKEPTTDPAVFSMLRAYGKKGEDLKKAAKKFKDTVAYSDPDCKHKIATWPSDYSNKPTRRNKRTMLNCVRRDIEWLPDKTD